ncbi:MAG TPA: type II secretion system protein [Candidatus Binatia bacterium]
MFKRYYAGRKLRQNEGFTLLELLVLIAVMGVLPPLSFNNS